MGKTPHGHRRIFQCIIVNVKGKRISNNPRSKNLPYQPAMKHNHNHDNASAHWCPSALNSPIRRPRPSVSPARSTIGSPRPRRCIPPASATGGRKPPSRPAPTNTASWWTANGCPIRWRAESVPNPFGGRNSILHVAHSPAAAHLADAENLPLKKTNKLKTKKYEQTNTSNQQ